MTSFVFKPKRRLNGKIVASRFYSGRYRLPGAAASTTVALKTADCGRRNENPLKRAV